MTEHETRPDQGRTSTVPQNPAARSTSPASQNGSGDGKYWRFAWDARLREKVRAGALTLADVGVLILLAGYADFGTGRNARPGLDRLAEDAGGVNPRTIQRSLQRGVDAGVIVQTARGGGPGANAKASTYAMLPYGTPDTGVLSSSPGAEDTSDLNSPVRQDMSESSHLDSKQGNSGHQSPELENSGQNSGQNSGHQSPTTFSTEYYPTTKSFTPPSFASLTPEGSRGTNDRMETHKQPLASLAECEELQTPIGDSRETPSQPSPSTAGLKDAGEEKVQEKSPTVLGSPRARLVAELLNLTGSDKRVQAVDEWLTAHSVKSPPAYIRSLHASGDLLKRLDEFTRQPVFEVPRKSREQEAARYEAWQAKVARDRAEQQAYEASPEGRAGREAQAAKREQERQAKAARRAELAAQPDPLETYMAELASKPKPEPVLPVSSSAEPEWLETARRSMGAGRGRKGARRREPESDPQEANVVPFRPVVGTDLDEPGEVIDHLAEEANPFDADEPEHPVETNCDECEQAS